MKTVATNETTQKPRGKDVVKKSPVRAGRGCRPRTGAVSTDADEVLDAVRAPETTEIEVEAEPIEAGNEAGENEAGENEAEAAADGAVGEKGSSTRSRRVVRAGRLSGLWRPRRVVAALAILALCAGGGYAGWKLYENRVADQAEQQAVATAKDYAVTLTSIDSGSIDENFAEVLAGATGEFKDMYSRSSSQLKQMLVDNKATSKGVVIDAGVKSASPGRVEVMLFVDQSITNTASPEPRVDRSRVVMTMEKVDGRWLASKVDLP
ncbi:hypothetical protein [Gordonia paraffinivorans]|uniref:hypothetical protein n=1 Tax=Gordonia paraffinivorans TaxID=175628 RepID=UPI001E64A099|nr:hypothetical protein [Gordonia paraffinivorans]MCD2145062.1 hypothetical protein [Gordonia paraffinivorans]